MTILHCDGSDIEIIGRALMASVDSSIFPEWEFASLIGRTRDDVRAVATRWPLSEGSATAEDMLIRNVLLNLAGYPHENPEQVERLVGASTGRLMEVLSRWQRTEST